MLTIGGSSGLATGPVQLVYARRADREPATTSLGAISAPVGSARAGALALDRRAAFHAQQMVQQLARVASPPGRNEMLAAYRAHLAARLRYFGPLAPVDLRV